MRKNSFSFQISEERNNEDNICFYNREDDFYAKTGIIIKK